MNKEDRNKQKERGIEKRKKKRETERETTKGHKKIDRFNRD